MDLAQLQSLLGNPAMRATAGVPPNLLEFRAGLCRLEGTTVTADPRKGKVVLQNEDGILHFKWQLRPHDVVEEDLMIMPGDCTFEKVPECTDGRVFFVQFKSSDRRLFFWLQEPKPDNDEQIFRACNEYFAGTRSAPTKLGEAEPAASSSNNSSASAARPAANGIPDLSSLGVDQNQLMSMLTGHLQQAAAQQGQPSHSAAARALSEMAQAQQGRSLNTIMDPELINPLLQDDDIVNAVLPHLPEGQQTKESLREQLRSPQLQQTLSRLTAALNSGQAEMLLAQLGLPRNQEIGVDALLTALKEHANKMKDDQPNGGN